MFAKNHSRLTGDSINFPKWCGQSCEQNMVDECVGFKHAVKTSVTTVEY